MKKKVLMITTIFFLLLFVICYVCFKKDLFQPENAYMPLTYKVCDVDSCIVLLGSIHVGDERITQFRRSINEIYRKSQYLAVELDTKYMSMNYNDFLLDSGKTLDDIITKELKEKITQFLMDKGSSLSYDDLKKFKLGFLSNYISLLSSTELGFTSPGVDSHFLTLAHDDGKEIIELETYEEQMGLLFDYSDALYSKQINDSIDSYDENKKQLSLLYEAYLKADKEKIESLLEEEGEPSNEEEEQYLNAMLYDRNKRMAEKVEMFLRENKDVFMIVGEAHVLGNGGIIDLLKRKDYQIEIVK